MKHGERLLAARKELDEAQKEEIEASNAYAGDDLTEDWHRGALVRLLRAEDEFKKATEEAKPCA